LEEFLLVADWGMLIVEVLEEHHMLEGDVVGMIEVPWADMVEEVGIKNADSSRGQNSI
jgi:hypothetical protein